MTTRVTPSSRSRSASTSSDAGHRRVGARSPAAGDRAGPGPGTRTQHHQLGLADIERGDPLDDLFVVLAPASSITALPSPARGSPEGGRPRGAAQDRAKLIRVLEAH